MKMKNSLLKKLVSIVLCAMLMAVCMPITVFGASDSGVCVNIAVVDADDDNSALAGAKIQILNAEDEIVEEWISDDKTYEVCGLNADEEYILRVDNIPEGYYFEGNEDMPFTVDEFGEVFCDELNISENSLLISFDKISQYYIPLLPKNITYGEPFGGNIIDLNNVTLNGEPFSNPYIGQAFYIECTDADGNIYDTRNGALIPAGTYTMTGKAYPCDEGVQIMQIYTFSDPVTVTIEKKTLTSDMFTVEADEKLYDGTTDVKLTVTIREEIPQDGISGIEIKGYEGQTPIYDEVTAVITGSFDSAEAGENKTITYKITGLEGKDAENYILPDGGISGTIENGVIKAVEIPEQDDEQVESPPTGDENSVWAWSVALFVGAVALILTSRKAKNE